MSLVEQGVITEEGNCEEQEPFLFSYLDPYVEEAEGPASEGDTSQRLVLTQSGRIMNEIILRDLILRNTRGQNPNVHHSRMQAHEPLFALENEMMMRDMGFPEDENARREIISNAKIFLDAVGFPAHHAHNLTKASDTNIGVQV